METTGRIILLLLFLVSVLVQLASTYSQSQKSWSFPENTTEWRPASTSTISPAPEKFVGIISTSIFLGMMLLLSGFMSLLGYFSLFWVGTIDHWTNFLQVGEDRETDITSVYTPTLQASTGVVHRFLISQWKRAPGALWRLILWILKGKRTHLLSKIMILIMGLLSIVALSIWAASASRGETFSEFLQNIIVYATQETDNPANEPQAVSLFGTHELAVNWNNTRSQPDPHSITHNLTAPGWMWEDLQKIEEELQIHLNSTAGKFPIICTRHECRELLHLVSSKTELLACMESDHCSGNNRPVRSSTPATTTKSKLIVLEAVTEPNSSSNTGRRLWRVKKQLTDSSLWPAAGLTATDATTAAGPVREVEPQFPGNGRAGAGWAELPRHNFNYAANDLGVRTQTRGGTPWVPQPRCPCWFGYPCWCCKANTSNYIPQVPPVYSYGRAVLLLRDAVHLRNAHDHLRYVSVDEPAGLQADSHDGVRGRGCVPSPRDGPHGRHHQQDTQRAHSGLTVETSQVSPSRTAERDGAEGGGRS